MSDRGRPPGDAGFGYIPRMSDGLDDNGITAHGLWACAWVLGIVAGCCLLRLLTYAADGVHVQAELFVWLLVGTVAGAFSACCAVLAGIKAMEQRLTTRLRTSTNQ